MTMQSEIIFEIVLAIVLTILGFVVILTGGERNNDQQ